MEGVGGGKNKSSFFLDRLIRLPWSFYIQLARSRNSKN